MVCAGTACVSSFIGTCARRRAQLPCPAGSPSLVLGPASNSNMASSAFSIGSFVLSTSKQQPPSFTPLGAGKLADYSGEAMHYFESFRTPAGLVAGSALAGLFAYADLVNTTSHSNRTRRENVALVLYHMCTLASLLLSVSVIITSTAVGNTMLLKATEPMATSPYAFLMREYEFEFLGCRWNFYASLLAFLVSVPLRVLLSFKLLVMKERRRTGWAVGLTSAALILSVINVVNTNLQSHQNILSMTLSFAGMCMDRTLRNGRRQPFLLASTLAMAASIPVALSRFRDVVAGSTDTHKAKKAEGEPDMTAESPPPPPDKPSDEAN